MKKVHLLINRTRIIDYLISPLLQIKSLLRENSYQLRFYEKLTPEFYNCDIIILVSKPLFKLIGEKKAVIDDPSPTMDVLRYAKDRAGKVVWLDSSDSTGVTHFELLPYVDLYLKKQLLNDLNLYKNEYYGGRIFTDYYHKKIDVVDENRFSQYFPLEDRYHNKVDLAWNIGLGDMYNAFTFLNTLGVRYRQFIPANYNINWTSPDKKKSQDIMLRTSANLDRNTVAYHRQELVLKINEILLKMSLTGSTTGPRLSTREFRRLMADSKIMPSPFGWGELGVRDYESFIFGALLLKPDVSHMRTFPNLFIENETYIPFKWDYSDLEEIIEELLLKDKKRIEIASNGQTAYKESISSRGLVNFLRFFIRQIEKE